ncbi:MAG: hypothetical protein JJ953_09060 [Gracilimonas sp.]|uniref:hypothetical protein n=1 Tax=Gracilimonas TaxID=649462 RepID=UPI001B1CFDC8|nr:hypothetical protein [Gracilimonas sp.]MBO6586238.1 hypothetical protein [Gracilimonas sp.]MBO6614895.1 hypothetical protein [Gracilimonas sp.]
MSYDNDIEEIFSFIKLLQFEILSSLRDNLNLQDNSQDTDGIHKHGDISYSIDVKAINIVIDFFKRNPFPGGCILVGEGIGEKIFTKVGTTPKYKLIIDPIDGTREIMYDKRSAWILTGVAPNKGPETNLEDIFLSIQTEIPVIKQDLFSFVSAEKNKGAFEEVYNANTLEPVSDRKKLTSSSAADLSHGYAVFVNFFPGAKTHISQIEEQFLSKVLIEEQGNALVFSDQYLSTGGQIFLLASGKYRMVADLRNSISSQHDLDNILCCHPYDLCTFLIAREAGCIISSPKDKNLNYNLSTSLDIDWIGFANKKLFELFQQKFTV